MLMEAYLPPSLSNQEFHRIVCWGPYFLYYMLMTFPLLFPSVFASDTKFVETVCQYSGLQQDLDSLHTWCSKRMFTLNSSTCAVMKFSLTSLSSFNTYTVNDQPIRSVEKHKEQRIMIKSNLSQSEHLKHTCHCLQFALYDPYIGFFLSFSTMFLPLLDSDLQDSTHHQSDFETPSPNQLNLLSLCHFSNWNWIILLYNSVFISYHYRISKFFDIIHFFSKWKKGVMP